MGNETIYWDGLIEDQLKVLKSRRSSVDVLQLENDEKSESLFLSDENCSKNREDATADDHARPLNCEPRRRHVKIHGRTQIVFTHPEALLSKGGRELMNSRVCQNNVVACVVDEAHCLEMW